MSEIKHTATQCDVCEATIAAGESECPNAVNHPGLGDVKPITADPQAPAVETPAVETPADEAATPKKTAKKS